MRSSPARSMLYSPPRASRSSRFHPARPGHDGARRVRRALQRTSPAPGLGPTPAQPRPDGSDPDRQPDPTPQDPLRPDQRVPANSLIRARKPRSTRNTSIGTVQGLGLDPRAQVAPAGPGAADAGQ